MNAKLQRYYFPGMISLIFIPLLFIYYYTKPKPKEVTYAIPIYIGDESLLKRMPELSARLNHKYPPQRHYNEITFTGDNKLDRVKLDNAEEKIGLILSTNDTLTGIHFKFLPGSEYGTFFRTVNLLRMKRANTFINMTTDIWFYHFATPPAEQARIF